MGDPLTWREDGPRHNRRGADGGDATMTHAATLDDPLPIEAHPVDIPVPPALLYRVGLNAQRQGVEVGGIYDDKIVAIAVYDRPWSSATHPGAARVIGTIYFSSRTDRVYRIEIDHANGGTYERLLDELERLTGVAAGPGSCGAGFPRSWGMAVGRRGGRPAAARRTERRW